jgi:hypothetical protein
MSRNVLRAPGAAAVLAFAGGLYMLLDGAGEDRRAGSAAKGVPTIVVRDGQSVGGVRELTFYSDEAIRFPVSSDTAREGNAWRARLGAACSVSLARAICKQAGGS